MHDLDIQIRDYIDATSDPLTIDDILHAPIGATPVRPITERPSGKRGWLVAAAAAGLVLAVVGLVPLLVRDTASPPSSDETSISPVVEGTDTLIVDTESLGPLRWTLFVTPDMDTPTWVSVDPQGGYVAHGRSLASYERGTELIFETEDWSDTVMHSYDAVVWRVLTGNEAEAAIERIDRGPFVTVSTPTLPRRMTSGFVSQGNFGYTAMGDSLDAEFGASWISVDGRTWELLFTPPIPTSGFIGGSAFGPAGDIIYQSHSGSAGAVLWIGRFES